MNVALCGSGAAAAFAAAACDHLGVTVDVYSFAKGTPAAGAFWLRDLPNGMPQRNEPGWVVSWSYGDAETYVVKQYGDEKYRKTPSSFPSTYRVERAYDAHEVWDDLWMGVRQWVNGFLTDATLRKLGARYDLVFHTFPTQESKLHQPPTAQFTVASMRRSDMHLAGKAFGNWMKGHGLAHRQFTGWDRTALNNRPNDYVGPVNWVVYSGKEGTPWVRMSYLWGALHVEYPVGGPPPPTLATGTLSLQQSLTPDHEPWPERRLASNIIPIGRFATWDKNTLSHEVYSRVSGILKSHTTGK